MRYSIWAGMAVFALATSAHAGTINGKISGAKGPSVVYVNAIAGKSFPVPIQHVVMNQMGMRFVPHLLVIQQGTTVDFLNSDNMDHNVAWVSVGGNEKLSHNMGTWPQGQRRSFKFDNLGAVQLQCWIHPDMSAVILVVPTPYFAVADKSGNYRIENVPDGTYTLTVWNAKTTVWNAGAATSHSMRVVVSGDTTQAKLSLAR